MFTLRELLNMKAMIKNMRYYENKSMVKDEQYTNYLNSMEKSINEELSEFDSIHKSNSDNSKGDNL